MMFIVQVACLVLAFSSESFGKGKPIVVGVEKVRYFPLYSNDEGEYIGFSRDVWDLFGSFADRRVRFEIKPVKRLYTDFVKKKRFDFKFPDNPYWQQDLKKKSGHKISYSEPVVAFTDGVMVVPERLGKGVGKLKILGTVRGFTAWDYLDQQKKGEVEIAENSSFSGLLSQVIKKRIDGAYINLDVANYHLREILKKPGALVFDPDLPHTKGHYFASTIENPEAMKKFNDFLKKNSGDIKKIKEKYQLSN